MAVDDTGREVVVPSVVRRVVSLVPSLTESVAVTAPGLLVGATDWCTHPGDLDVPRVGGTKNPRVPDVLDLRPDVVVANEEENRAEDLAALRDAGVAVWVTAPQTVAAALDSLERMLTLACRLPVPEWLDEARSVWRPRPHRLPRLGVVVPIWRRPWMVLGPSTFAADVLRSLELGIVVLAPGSPDRYPRTTVEEILALDPACIVLPSEPYAFTHDDGPEAFPGIRCQLVDGRLLTWYGPSLVQARDELSLTLRTSAPHPGTRR